MPLHAVRTAMSAIALAAVAVVAGCSLLAPSDEEAMGGATPAVPAEGGAEASAADASTDTRVDAPDARPTGPTPECGSCPRACNGAGRTCAACLLNGGKCRVDDECCTGTCNSGACGPSAGACQADNQGCVASPDSCCTGLSCSQERGGRCAACVADDQNCKADTDCCSVRCGASGKCAACLAKGATGCTSDRQCCSNVCVRASGTCQ